MVLRRRHRHISLPMVNNGVAVRGCRMGCTTTADAEEPCVRVRFDRNPEIPLGSEIPERDRIKYRPRAFTQATLR